MAATCIALCLPFEQRILLDTLTFARIACAALRPSLFLCPIASLALYFFSVCDFLFCTLQCFVKAQGNVDMNILAMKELCGVALVLIATGSSKRIKVEALLLLLFL
jgi:hypothetical protein